MPTITIIPDHCLSWTSRHTQSLTLIEISAGTLSSSTEDYMENDVPIKEAWGLDLEDQIVINSRWNGWWRQGGEIEVGKTMEAVWGECYTLMYANRIDTLEALVGKKSTIGREPCTWGRKNQIGKTDSGIAWCTSVDFNSDWWAIHCFRQQTALKSGGVWVTPE